MTTTQEALETTLFPISEYFDSIQGEGFWAGTRMFFIRFAGCTVGKRFPSERYNPDSSGRFLKNLLPILPTYINECTIYDGRKFECDTDYRVKERLTVSQILTKVPTNVKHICLTGGEPLMHPLQNLIHEIAGDVMVHIETSGTIDSSKLQSAEQSVWISVSPKEKVLDCMIHKANEIKLLIDKDFDINTIPKAIFSKGSRAAIYIQPINYENDVDFDNVKRCLDLQQQFPHWRLSIQLHKIVKVR